MSTINIFNIPIKLTLSNIKIGGKYLFSKKERVAILLPFNPPLDLEKGENPMFVKAIKDDGAAQLRGIFNFIGNNDGQSDNDKIEYIFIDHQNNADFAINTVTKELNKGVRYFFSTMSEVNEKISEKFSELTKRKNAICVCTVSATPDVKTQQNKVYRFYPRSTEEGKELADFCIENSIKNVVGIVIGSPYGHSTEKQFREKLSSSGITQSIFIKVDFKHAQEYIEKEISNNVNKFNGKQTGILICHYGIGLQNIVKALDNTIFKDNGIYKDRKQLPLLLFTSTLQSDLWQQLIPDILSKVRYCIAIPSYKKNINNYTDVVKNFTQFAFTKLIKSIINLKEKKYKNKTFDEIWIDNDLDTIQEQLNLSYNKGDAIIQMKIEKHMN